MDKARALALLRKARKFVATEERNLICLALDLAEHHTVGNGQSYYLKAWIHGMLGSCDTYLEWIKVYHPKLFDAVPFDERVKKAKEGRLAWIDWMIQEVQK